VNVRKWIATVAIAAGSTLGAFADDPNKGGAKAPDPSLVSFGTLRALPAETAQAKVGSWLTGLGKMDQAKFDAIWASDKTTGEKTVASIALGKPEAQAALDDARDITKDAPTGVPAVIADEKDAFVKANLGAAYARALAGKKVYEEALLAVKDRENRDRSAINIRTGSKLRRLAASVSARTWHFGGALCRPSASLKSGWVVERRLR